MQRHYQTLARIGAGFTAFMMLAWLLWPRSTPILEREEALFAFLIAIFFWILTEIKESDEIVFRASTPNDIRLARQIVSYATDKFKILLHEHDFRRGINARFLTEASSLVHEAAIGTAFFQDKRLKPTFDDFCRSLGEFCSYMAEHSAPEGHRGGLIQRIVPAHVDAFQLNQRQLDEIEEANRLASKAWDALELLIPKIKDRVPEAFDEPIDYGWFRSRDD